MKPILFNTDMVKAIIEGRKTATRRLIKDPYTVKNYSQETGLAEHKGIDTTHGMPFPDAPYKVGDILYIRETWRVQAAHRFEADARIEFKAGGPMVTIQFPGRCSDSHERPSFDAFINKWMNSEGNRWRPSIFMPKEAARLFLRVTDVRVERLWDIHEKYESGLVKPVIKEGCRHLSDFIAIWQNTIKPADRPRFGWEANPWVWVIEFERCDKPED